MIKQTQSATISMKDISDTGNFLQQKTVHLVIHGFKYADKHLYLVDVLQICAAFECFDVKFTFFSNSNICKIETILKESRFNMLYCFWQND